MKNERKTLTLPGINAKSSPQGQHAAPGPPSGAGLVYGPPLPRAAVYFDGFNFFHAIDDTGDNYLKWVNLWALSKGLIGPIRDLKRVVWCSAKHPDAAKAARWVLYRDALLASGVTIARGHFTAHVPVEEKESDVNLALHLMLDAIDNVFDVAYLVTADSDQAATARLFKQRFGNTKRLVAVAPLGRDSGKDILKYADEKAAITRSGIENALFDAQVKGLHGRLILRPARYAPPAGWMSDRQRKLALLAASTAKATPEVV